MDQDKFREYLKRGIGLML